LTRKLRAKITHTVQEAISAHIQKNEVTPPEGYNPAAAIRGALYQWVYVPFGVSYALMQLRCPSAGEVPDGVRVLEAFGKKKERYSRAEIIEFLNIQEKLARAVMNNPTFVEMEKQIAGADRVTEAHRRELLEIRNKVDGNHTLEREFKAKIDLLELQLGYILPQNTMAFLTQWALCLDVTDAKKLSSEKLLDAAILAKRNRNEPADNVAGVFATSQRDEINRAAWMLYVDKYERKRK
jgi:hypothetical protein